MKVALPQVVNGRPPGTRSHLSFSAVSLYQSCSLRYYFRYVARLPEKVTSASLVFGSAMHAAVQYHFEQLLAGQAAPAIDSLLGAFWESWHEHDGVPVRFSRGDDINSIGKLAERLLRHFQASAFATPPGTIIGVEEELRGVLVPGLPEFLGRVDLLIETADALFLSDFKTTRTGWSEEHIVDSASQLLLYGELARNLSDGKPLRLSFAVLTKNKLPELTVHPVVVDAHQVVRTKRIFERVWRAIQGGNFYPNPSPMNCPTCPYRDACRAWTG